MWLNTDTVHRFCALGGIRGIGNACVSATEVVTGIRHLCPLKCRPWSAQSDTQGHWTARLPISPWERYSLFHYSLFIDTVCHKHILEVLKRKGEDEQIRELIKNSYKNCYTKVNTKAGETAQIWLQRGVQAGWPSVPRLIQLGHRPTPPYPVQTGDRLYGSGDSSSIFWRSGIAQQFLERHIQTIARVL